MGNSWHDIRLLWVVTLDTKVGEFHGAGMRFINFARELGREGASVYFAVNVWRVDDEQALTRYLDGLVGQRVITGYLLLHYNYTAQQGRWGAAVFYPGLTNWVLRNARREPVEALVRYAEDNRVTAAIVSDRKLMFLSLPLKRLVPTVLDWTDSMMLYYWRALGRMFEQKTFAGLSGFLRDYQTNAIVEMYFGRRATLNTVVSPVDKAWLDKTNLKPSRNRVWMNGTAIQEISTANKVARRMIFSGTMDYPPNYEGALWFLDQVFPQLAARFPDAELIIAGVNPISELASRATERIRITGFVPDLGAEIAASSLYVAPLFSGGGFRNKVIESIMYGTYLIGTSISVEFLPLEFRRLLITADTAAEMTAAITDYFECPERYSERLGRLREIVVSEFSWHGRTSDLVGFLREAETIYSRP